MEHEPDMKIRGDLVSTGGLDLAKNQQFLLEVLAEAKRSGHRITLDLFGEGPLRQALEQRVTELGLDGQVSFHGFRRDVREFLPGYRAYVHASYAETSSFAIIEAMAAGLPILAARIGGIPELYDDGSEGRFWSLDAPAEAAAMLTELLDNEPARAAAGEAARSRFTRQFDAAVTAPRLLAFLYGDTSSVPPAAESKPLTPFTLDSRLR
jgi:glycosyltransferase involved in cell wall biosynthesis